MFIMLMCKWIQHLQSSQKKTAIVLQLNVDDDDDQVIVFVICLFLRKKEYYKNHDTVQK